MLYDARLLFVEICIRLDQAPGRSVLDLSRELQIDTRTIQNAVATMTGTNFSHFKDDMLIGCLTRLFLGKPNSSIKELSGELGYEWTRTFARAVRAPAAIHPRSCASASSPSSEHKAGLALRHNDPLNHQPEIVRLLPDLCSAFSCPSNFDPLESLPQLLTADESSPKIKQSQGGLYINDSEREGVMKTWRLRLICASVFAMLVVVLMTGGRISSVSAVECAPLDQSYVIDELTCGGRDWELVAADLSGDQWDEGEYTQTGMCGGGYTDCDCKPVGNYTLNATKAFHDQQQPDGSRAWWWDLSGYQPPTYTTCTSGACAGTGQVEHKNPITFYSEGYDVETTICGP